MSTLVLSKANMALVNEAQYNQHVDDTRQSPGLLSSERPRRFPYNDWTTSFLCTYIYNNRFGHDLFREHHSLLASVMKGRL